MSRKQIVAGAPIFSNFGRRRGITQESGIPGGGPFEITLMKWDKDVLDWVTDEDADSIMAYEGMPLGDPFQSGTACWVEYQYGTWFIVLLGC